MKNKWIYFWIGIFYYPIFHSQDIQIIPENIPITDCTIKNWHLSQRLDSIERYTDTLCSHVDLRWLRVEANDAEVKSKINRTLDDAFFQFFTEVFWDDGDDAWNMWLDTFFVNPKHHSSELYTTATQYWIKKTFIDMTLGMYNMSNQKQILTIAVGYDAFNGGAHAFQSSKVFNFDASSGKQIELSDCFDSNALKLLEKFAQMEWMQNDPDSIFSLSEHPFFLSSNFQFDNNGLHLLYNTYEIGPYAMGPPEILIPTEIYKPLIQPTCLVAQLYK